MTAEGKITTKGIHARTANTVKVLITDDPAGHAPATPGHTGPWRPAVNKTGMAVATVLRVDPVQTGRGLRYDVVTDLGEVRNLTGGQTFWLADPPQVRTETNHHRAGDPERPAQGLNTTDRTPEQPLPTPEPCWSTAGRVLDPEVADAFPPATTDYPGYSVAHLIIGDTVRIGDRIDPVTVVNAWWDSATTAHRLVLSDGRDLTIPRDDRTRNVCTLVARPGVGSFHHEYQVGDRVTVLGMNGLRNSNRGYHEPASPQVGVVTAVHRHEPGPAGVVYEASVVSNSLALGPDCMNPDPTPMPTAGQVWVSTSGRLLYITRVSPDTETAGLVADGVILGTPHWRIATADEAAQLRFDQQHSTDGGRTWRTCAVGLTIADADAARQRDPDGEHVRWRVVADTTTTHLASGAAASTLGDAEMSPWTDPTN